MFRYVALIWDVDDSQQSDAAQAADTPSQSVVRRNGWRRSIVQACACCALTCVRARSSRSC